MEISQKAIDALSNLLYEVSCVSTNEEEAREINGLVLQCQTLMCQQIHLGNEMGDAFDKVVG